MFIPIDQVLPHRSASEFPDIPEIKSIPSYYCGDMSELRPDERILAERSYRKTGYLANMLLLNEVDKTLL